MSWQRALSRDVFSQGALYELGSALTLFEISSFADENPQRFTECPSKPRDAGQGDDNEEIVLRDIHETTNDFIAKKLRTDFKGALLSRLSPNSFARWDIGTCDARLCATMA